MNECRFSPEPAAPAAQAFVVVPACLAPSTPGCLPHPLYAWALAQAQAAQQRPTRVPELFGILN